MTNANIFSGAPSQVLKTAAPARAASPTRTRPTAPPRMPSPRSSPAIRPTSPLSPRFENSQFQTMQPPSPRSMHNHHRAAVNSARRVNTTSLKLPSLPRFHPANFPSPHSSAQPTPESGAGSPQAPASPRTHQRVVSDAQKQLLMYQRETVSVARASSPAQIEKPLSPRLVPLGSPGPVTPLELEAEEGYLAAGARSRGGEDATENAEELLARLIQEETTRQRRLGGYNPPGYGDR